MLFALCLNLMTFVPCHNLPVLSNNYINMQYKKCQLCDTAIKTTLIFMETCTHTNFVIQSLMLASTTQLGTPNVLLYTQATSTIPFLHKGTCQTDDCTHIIRTVDISTLIQQELYPLLIPFPRCLNQCSVSFLKRSTHVCTTRCDENMTYCKK